MADQVFWYLVGHAIGVYFYPPPEFYHQETFLTDILLPAYTLHQYATITTLLDTTSSMVPLIAKLIFAKQYSEENETILYDLQWLRGEKHITFTILRITKFIRNLCENTSDWINEKPYPLYVCARTYLPKCHNWISIWTYLSHMIKLFNIWSHFRASLSSNLM